MSNQIFTKHENGFITIGEHHDVVFTGWNDVCSGFINLDATVTNKLSGYKMDITFKNISTEVANDLGVQTYKQLGEQVNKKLVMTDDVEGFAHGYATRIIHEMNPKENWEDWETWHGRGEWDINFHVRDGYLYADAYPWDNVTGLRTDEWVRVFAEWIK